MKEIVSDPQLVAACGLYCGACKRYLKDSCPGCHENDKATWCRVRTCCQGHAYATCADCTEFADPKDCGKFNNLIARLFGLIFRSDRAACIAQIRALGLQGHADDMTQRQRQSLPR